MKNALLFAVLILSMNVFAQGKERTADQQLHSSLYIQNMQAMTRGQEWKISDLHSRINPVSMLLEIDTVIPPPEYLNDSIHHWNLTLDITGWDLDSKMKSVNITYDDSHQLTNYTEQYCSDSLYSNFVQYAFTYDGNKNEASYTILGWDGGHWYMNEQFEYTHDDQNNLTSSAHIFWNGALVHDYKRLYHYNSNHQLEQAIIQIWDGLSWRNYFNIILTVDESGNLVNESMEWWNGNDWENFVRILYTFDFQNNLTSYTRQSWNGSMYINEIREIFTYDVTNNLTTDLYQVRQGDFLVNSSLSLYSYDDQNNMTSRLDQIWNNGVWLNQWRYQYTYDVSNNKLSEFYQIWEDSAWRNDHIITYEYDAHHNVISSTYQDWYGEWHNAFKTTYTYDERNNRTTELEQIWGGSWEPMFINIYTYDSENLLTGHSYKCFDYYEGNGTIVTGGDSTHYYFNTVTAIKDLPVDAGNILVYPNPTNGKFTIRSQGNLSEVEVYNLAGERIYFIAPAEGQNDFDINLDNHPKGIYVLQIHNGMKTYNRMIAVQ